MNTLTQLLERLEFLCIGSEDPDLYKDIKAYLRSNAAKQKAEQEPIGTVRQANGCTYVEWNHVPPEAGTVCYAAPQAREPAQYLCNATRFKLSFGSDGSETSLSAFSRELQGKWVALVDATDNKHLSATQAREPMSDDEIDEIMIDNKNYRTFARAIEAHHGIK